MKYNGKKIEGPNVEYIVIPRVGGDIVFKATAVLDMKPFYDMCPLPKAPKVMVPGGQVKENVQDKDFLNRLQEYGNLRYYFTIVWSLKDSPGIEWDTVKLTEPQSWLKLEDELKEAGFSYREIQHIILGCLTANSLNEAKLEEARERFLASQAEQLEKSISPPDAQVNTPSGEPANA